MAYIPSYLPHVLTTVLVLFLIRKYRERKWGKCRNNVKLDGKLAIVTGGNCGIGFEIAKELAARNAQVILACRDMDKARDAIACIKQSVLTDPVLVAMELDLASLHSIKHFAETVLKNYPSVDILVNNAGVAFPPSKRVETKDGFEVHFGVNHLGHFYLTNLLLNNIKGRIVIISSSLHEKGIINFEDLNSTALKMKKSNLYSNSKLANVYFCRELAKKTKANKINVYACCPGWVYTQLFRHSVKWYHYILVVPVAFFFMRGAKQGSQTPIYCITEPNLAQETGLLYRDCKQYNSKHQFDDAIGAKLWEQSELMIRSVLGANTGLP